MYVQQTQYTIEKLVGRIRGGRLALPDFQRPFVWGPAQVASLLDSIAREWPIGSLLLLKGPQPFAFRPVDSGPDVLESELDLYVLDGQQRVTSVYHAIRDVSPYVYYVDFRGLADEDDEIVSWDHRSKFERRFKTLQERAAAGLALVSDFWENEKFQEWLDLISEPARRLEFVSLREKRLAGLQAKVYQFLAIELEQGIELGALARIFETLNKTGVRLDAFDLLVAKLYPTKFNLRERWDQCKEDSDLLSGIDPDGLEIIKLVSLLVRGYEGRSASKGVRQGDILAIKAEYVKKYWDRAVYLYTQALALAQQFGVTKSYLVPNWSMILGLAGCIEYGLDGRAREWWTSRLRTQAFGQAANTRIVAEFDAFSQGQFEKVGRDEATGADLLPLQVRANGLLLRGLTGLVAASGAVDPLTGAPLSSAQNIEWLQISQSGNELLKISSNTDFSNVIFLSSASSKILRRNLESGFSNISRELLQNQGFDLASMRRSSGYIEEILK